MASDPEELQHSMDSETVGFFKNSIIPQLIRLAAPVSVPNKQLHAEILLLRSRALACLNNYCLPWSLSNSDVEIINVKEAWNWVLMLFESSQTENDGSSEYIELVQQISQYAWTIARKNTVKFSAILTIIVCARAAYLWNYSTLQPVHGRKNTHKPGRAFRCIGSEAGSYSDKCSVKFLQDSSC